MGEDYATTTTVWICNNPLFAGLPSQTMKSRLAIQVGAPFEEFVCGLYPVGQNTTYAYDYNLK